MRRRDVAAAFQRIAQRQAEFRLQGLREGTDPLDGALIAANDGLFKPMADTIRA